MLDQGESGPQRSGHHRPTHDDVYREHDDVILDDHDRSADNHVDGAPNYDQRAANHHDYDASRAAVAPPSGGSATYANCSEARAAGVTPLYRGQPGYAPKLDRDGDGVACE